MDEQPICKTGLSRPSRVRLAAALVVMPTACSAGVLDPGGPIGRSDLLILLDSVAIMACIVVPVIVATLAIAWWFRASNTKATYLPNWSFSGRLEILTWSIPAMVVLFLGGVAWVGSHDLDPAKPLASPVQPLEVEVVSLDWKWLFIYPDQGVASVNRLVIPAGVPVHFRLTSATVMNSFFVPRLGSQIYTMAGMTTQLNLLADKPGTFSGLSAQFSGAGFSHMRFDVESVSPAGFTNWVAAAKSGSPALDGPAYAQLAKPSEDNPVATYSAVPPRLFETIVLESAPGSMGSQAVADASTSQTSTAQSSSGKN